MEWELAWIDANVHLYDSPMHAEAVKRNIEKRYRILELQSELKQAKDTSTYQPFPAHKHRVLSSEAHVDKNGNWLPLQRK